MKKMEIYGRKMAGKLAMFLLIFSVASIIGIGMAAAAAPTVSIDPEYTTGLSPGDTFSVNVSVDPDTYGVKACKIDLTYNSSALTATGVTQGELLGSPTIGEPTNDYSTPGKIHWGISRTSANPTPVPTSPGTFITIAFSVNAGALSGTYTLDLSNATLNNETSAEIPSVEVNDGYATVIAPDREPPVISNVASSSITTTSATIAWDTDEVSDSLVKYGTTSGTYTLTASDPADDTSHSISLTGLSAGTTYYYVVNSTDPSDNSAESIEYRFTTTELAPTYRRGGGGAPRDTDGDGYSDVQEMLAGTDKDDPCDPNAECAACIALKPAATPTAAPTAAPTAKPTTPPAPTPEPTVEPTAEPTPTEEPGFEAVFAIAGLLAVAYLALRRKRK